MTDRATVAAVLALLLAAPAAAQTAHQADRQPGGTPGAGPGSSPAAQTAPGPSEKTEPGAAESRQATPGGEAAVKPGEQRPQGLWDRGNLFGDLGGLRTHLSDRGVTFGLTETDEVFGNSNGGVRKGVIYEGLTQFGVGVDTEKLFGLKGGTFNATGYQTRPCRMRASKRPKRRRP